MAVLVGLGFGARSALAEVWDSWDWHLVGGEPKRTLHYCIDPNLDANLPDGNIDWNDAVEDAAKNWNDAATGWTLTKVAWDSPDCQIKIKAGETGGNIAEADCPRDKDNRVAQCTITIDPTPGTSGKKWGKDDGTDAATTWNTRWTIKHEFGHTMRLGHSDAGQIMRPDVASDGDDNLTPNADDKQEAKDAVTEPINTESAMISPGTGATLVVTDFVGNTVATVIIPANAVSAPVTVFGSVDNYVSTPDDDAVPGSMAPVSRSLYLRDASGSPISLLQPAAITIHYADLFDDIVGNERERESTVVPAGSALPGVSETTLRVLTLTEGTDPWNLAVVPTIDTVAHKVSFSTSELKTYGLSGRFEGAVGGIAELPDVAQAPASQSASSASSGPPYAVLAGGLAAAAVVALGAGGWYARRRFSRG